MNEGIGMESSYVTNPRDGVRVHTLRWGHGPRMIVAVHGLNAHAWHWRRTAERLGPEYSLIAYDLRGHGESDKPATGYSYEEQGSDIEAILADAGVTPQDTIIMGHSLGSRVAMPYVAGRPFRGFVIVDPGIVPHVNGAQPPRPEGARSRPPLQMEYASREEFMERMSRTNFLRNRHEYNEEYAARLIGEPEADGTVRLQLTPTAHVETMRAISAGDLSLYFEQLTCPCLVIRATEGHLVQPMAERMACEISDCELVVIEGSNHNVMLDRPDEFDAALESFLARLFG